jgi:hypothetical protein
LDFTGLIQKNFDPNQIQFQLRNFGAIRIEIAGTSSMRKWVSSTIEISRPYEMPPPLSQSC